MRRFELHPGVNLKCHVMYFRGCTEVTGKFVSDHVYLNLLNELEKNIKCEAVPSI